MGVLALSYLGGGGGSTQGRTHHTTQLKGEKGGSALLLRDSHPKNSEAEGAGTR